MFFVDMTLCLTFGVLLLRDGVDAPTPVLTTLYFLIRALFLLECDLVDTVSRFLLFTGDAPIFILVLKSVLVAAAPRLLTYDRDASRCCFIFRFPANANHTHSG